MHITPYSGNFYMLEDNGMKSFFALPYIKVVQDNNLQEIKVDLKISLRTKPSLSKNQSGKSRV